MEESQNNSTNNTSLKIIIALLVVIIFLLVSLAATYYYFWIKGWKVTETDTPAINNEINNRWTDNNKAQDIDKEKSNQNKEFKEESFEDSNLNKKFEEKTFEWTTNKWTNKWLTIDENLKFTQFLLTTKNLYCAYKSALYNFADISKENWTKKITEDSTNVVKQRDLWRQIIENFENNGIPEIASEYLETYTNDTYFKELVSYIWTTHKYITNFLDADSQIKNFSDYQNVMLSDFTMAANTIKKIPEELNILYKEFISINEISNYYYAKKEDVEASKNVVDIDSLCN